MADYGWAIFTIGFLLGAMVTIVIVWILYATQTFIFSNCVSSTPGCVSSDFFNDPGEAIAAGYKLEDIIEIVNGVMYYKRVQKNTCMPHSDQTVQVKYPEYCTMTGPNISGTWQQTLFGSNIYTPDGFSGQTVVTDGNCKPMTGYMVTDGTPQLKWNSTF